MTGTFRKETGFVRLDNYFMPRPNPLLEIAGLTLRRITDPITLSNCQSLKYRLPSSDTCQLEVGEIKRVYTAPQCPDVGIVGIYPVITPYRVSTILTAHHPLLEPEGKAVVDSHSPFPSPRWERDPFVFLPLDIRRIHFEEHLKRAKGLIGSFAETVTPLPFFRFSKEHGEHQLQIGLPELYQALNGKGHKKNRDILNHFNQFNGNVEVIASPAANHMDRIENLSELKDVLPEMWLIGIKKGLDAFGHVINDYYNSAVDELHVPGELAQLVCGVWMTEACLSLKTTEKLVFQTK